MHGFRARNVKARQCVSRVELPSMAEPYRGGDGRTTTRVRVQLSASIRARDKLIIDNSVVKQFDDGRHIVIYEQQDEAVAYISRRWIS